MSETVFVATWRDGLFAVGTDARQHELAGRSVRWIAPDVVGGVLAIVDGHALWQRSAAGQWREVATWREAELACCVACDECVFVGTDDARVLRVAPDGQIEALRAFDSVAGRESWFAGSAIIDGKTVGPPLGVRSISATADGSLLLANVHVGGIPRSTDGGLTWHPTIDIETDVHEVRVHPTHPERAVAASAVGLCASADGGSTWEVQTAGLHATYCSAVAFVGDDVLVAASDDHFSDEGALYRRSVQERNEGLSRVESGLPRWCAGIVDTSCIATRGACVAAADRGGNLYLSNDAGRRWHRLAEGLPVPSSVVIATAPGEEAPQGLAPGGSA